MKKAVARTLVALVVMASVFLIGCPAQEPEKVAEFEVRDLTVAQTSLVPEESTTVNVAVENVGDASGSYEVELEVNGEIHQSEEVTLDPGERTTVSFVVSFEKEGSYEVTVANMKATITVAMAEPPALDVAQAAANFLLLLDKGEYAAAVKQFDETMRMALPAEKLKEVWEGAIVAHFGPLVSLGESKVFEEAGFQIVLLRVNFERDAANARFAFDRTGRIAGFFFLPPYPISAVYTPPDYVNKEAFLEEEVVFGAEGWELPGTLSVPRGEGPFPAVMLVHGSGPQDRDQSIGPNKPFKDLAWGLATNGIAVLRYDKRTKVHGLRMAADITVEEEVIEDALLALDFLRKQEGIDPERVFLLGHSLGGMLAPEIANRDGMVAGVIVLAGPSRPMLEVILEQVEYISLLDGKISEEEEEMRKWFNKLKNHQLGEDEIVPGLGGPAGYWYDLHARNPVEEALKLPPPLLILQGERDYQVTIEDFEGWQEGLAARENVTFKLYPDLNHLFMAGEGKSTPGEYDRPGNVDEQVIKDISAWIRNLGT